MNLQQKLIEIRKNVIEFTKDTNGYGYKYVSGSQAIRKIRDKMDELGVLLFPSCTGQDQYSTFDYKNSKGEDKTDFIVNGDMIYTWQNADNPEEIINVPWKYYGAQDDISKAFGSALTYSERYFILKFFQAPTDGDDPDARDTSSRSSGKSNKLSEAQINRLYAIAHSKNINRETVQSQVLKQFRKKVENLTKEEYEKACSAYQNV